MKWVLKSYGSPRREQVVEYQRVMPRPSVEKWQLERDGGGGGGGGGGALKDRG